MENTVFDILDKVANKIDPEKSADLRANDLFHLLDIERTKIVDEVSNSNQTDKFLKLLGQIEYAISWTDIFLKRRTWNDSGIMITETWRVQHGPDINEKILNKIKEIITEKSDLKSY